MRKTGLLIVIFLSSIIVLSSCAISDSNMIDNNTAEPSSSTSSIPQPSVNDITTSIIENLPEELLISRESSGNECWAAERMTYTFDIDKETLYSITTQINRGDLKLSIKNKNADKNLYDAQDAASITDSVTLDKGTYCVIISGKIYDGYMHILNEDEVSAAPIPNLNSTIAKYFIIE